MADGVLVGPTEMERLRRFLTREGPPLRLGLVRVDDLRVIPRLLRELSECCRISTLQLGREAERANLIKRMQDASSGDALFVLGLEQLLFDEFGRMCTAPSLADLNAQRDVLPRWLTGRILLWVPDRAYPAYREGLRNLDDFAVLEVHLRERLEGEWKPIRLHDLYDWLAPPSEERRESARRQREILLRMQANTSGLGAAELAADIAVVAIAIDDIEQARDWTERAVQGFVEQARADQGARALRRLAEAELFFGDDARALAVAERAVELARGAYVASELAHALGLRAGLLVMRGDLDDAAELWRTEIRPLVEQLTDPRERAWLADRSSLLALACGESDEALAWRQQQLALIEPTEDACRLAVARRRLADVLVARGELDQAVLLMCDEVMPVFERLGDSRELALTWGTIADVRLERGEFGEARRIREQVQLPVLEGLGDVRECAVVWAKLGEIAWAQGQVDEALRLFEQARPGFERVCDRGALACVDDRLASTRAVASSTDRDDRADSR